MHFASLLLLSLQLSTTMGNYLYTEIRLFVTVVNQNLQSTYLCAAYGANLTPAQFQLTPGAQQVTQGAMSVPNAEIGAEGTYPLEQTRWDVQPPSGVLSTAILSGTVTYVTVELLFETQTTQTIDVTPQVDPAQVPIDTAHVHFINDGTPSITLLMVVFAGSVNLAAADKKDYQAAATNNGTISMKRVITQKKEKDSGDKT